MHSSGKTPLIRLAKRDGMAGAGQWGIRIAAILLALVVGGLVILLSGNNPIQGYAIIVEGALGKLKETLKGTDTAAIKAATDALTQDFYAVSEKLYQQANPQGAQGGAQAGPDMGGQQGGNAQGGQYYDADYKVVDDDDQNKK